MESQKTVDAGEKNAGGAQQVMKHCTGNWAVIFRIWASLTKSVFITYP